MMKKCINSVCNAELEDCQERCPDCGRLQEQECLTNRIPDNLEDTTITTTTDSMEYRHGFVTFWLWLGFIRIWRRIIVMC